MAVSGRFLPKATATAHDPPAMAASSSICMRPMLQRQTRAASFGYQISPAGKPQRCCPEFPSLASVSRLTIRRGTEPAGKIYLYRIKDDGTHEERVSSNED